MCLHLGRFLMTAPPPPTRLITLFLLASRAPSGTRLPEFRLVLRVPAGRLFLRSGTPFRLSLAANSIRDFTLGFSATTIDGRCCGFSMGARRDLLLLLLICDSVKFGVLAPAPRRCLILFYIKKRNYSIKLNSW